MFVRRCTLIDGFSRILRSVGLVGASISYGITGSFLYQSQINIEDQITPPKATATIAKIVYINRALATVQTIRNCIQLEGHSELTSRPVSSLLKSHRHSPRPQLTFWNSLTDLLLAVLENPTCTNCCWHDRSPYSNAEEG